MSQDQARQPDTELTLALKELVALGVDSKARGNRDVKEFLGQLKEFVSESAEEIASAYLKEALKQSLSELTGEIASKVAGLALKHFTVILLTIFFEQTDRSLKSTQKWLFLSALNSGAAGAIQALNAVCVSDGDFALRDHLLKTSITQLNEAYEMSKKDPRILVYVRLLQGLASEALGAHAFTRHYLSDCLPQFRERFRHFKAKSEQCADRSRDCAKSAAKIRQMMAHNPGIAWTHCWPETRGDLEVGFEPLDKAIERFNKENRGKIQYVENPESLEADTQNFREWGEEYRKQMEFFAALVQLAEQP
jgi:hypothetical protein